MATKPDVAGPLCQTTPVAVGGLGGSGTRLIASLLQEAGIFIGRDLNRSLDNLTFTFLVARPEHYFLSASELQHLFAIFDAAMNDPAKLSPWQQAHVSRLVRHPHSRYPQSWSHARAHSLLHDDTPTPAAKRPWGWKEPNTHVFITRLLPTCPHIKYIHVVRNGLDMAFSANQNQLLTWGPYFLGRAPQLCPHDALKFWHYLHRRLLAACGPMAERFLWLDYDRFCQDARPQLRILLRFLEVEVSPSQFEQLLTRVNPPRSLGRYRLHNLRQLDPSDVAFVERMGFDTGSRHHPSPRAHLARTPPGLSPAIAHARTAGAPAAPGSNAPIVATSQHCSSSKTKPSDHPDPMPQPRQTTDSPHQDPQRRGRSVSQPMRRKALLVLGMHRSGTSALTRVLNLYGAALPSHLMAGAPDDNPKGFWESLEIYHLNDAILAAAGSRWDDWDRVALQDIAPSVLADFQSRALDILRRDFPRSELFVLKDPRISRLLPFWLPVLQQFDSAPHCLLAFRNPIEVAASVQARDDIPPAKTHLVWLRHNLDVLRDTKDLPLAAVSYSDVLNDSQAVLTRIGEDFDLRWPASVGDAAPAAQDFLEQTLQHHKSSVADLAQESGIPKCVRDGFQALLDLNAGANRDALAPRLAGIENALDASLAVAGAALRAIDVQNKRLSSELEQAKSKSRDCLRTLRAQSDQIAAQETHHKELSLVIQATFAERDAARAAWRLSQERLDALKSKLATTKASLRERDKRLERAKAQMASMYESTSWRLTRPVRGVSRSLQIARSLLSGQRGAQQDLPAHSLQGPQETPLTPTPAVADASPHPVGADQRDLRPAPLRMPNGLPATPEISIIIPVYNNCLFTLACLDSIARIPDRRPFEVIVVDDGSSDDTQDHLSHRSDIRYLRNPDNVGFVGACNEGARQARGEYLYFLNNDTVLVEGAIDHLVETFVEHPRVGLVGSMLIYPDGTLQEAGGVIWDDASGWNWGRNKNAEAPEYNFVRDVDYCSGASLMIRRTLFQRLGGFDQTYAPGYYEDTDLAFAVRAAGLRVLYQPHSRVIHYEGQTSGTSLESGMKAYQRRNRERFLYKWREALRDHGQPSSRAAHLSADRSPHARVLVIDSCTPTPDQDSGSIDMYNYLRIFTDLGCRVTFLPYSDLRHAQGYTASLQALGVECVFRPFVDSLESFIAERGTEFSCVMLTRGETAYECINTVRAGCPQAKVIFNTVDLHFLRERRRAELETGQSRSFRAIELEYKERYVMERSDITIVISNAEATLLAEEAPHVPVTVVPLLRECPGRTKDFVGRKAIVFVGGFRHPPNVDAVQWFCNETWPCIRAKLPDCELLIAGSHMTDQVKALAGNGVKILGFVEDLDSLFAEVKLSVAPLRYGAGLKGKVATSLGYGVPCVASSVAAEGLEVGDDSGVVVADEPAQFASEIYRLYEDEALWERLSLAGQKYASTHFSLDSNRDRVARLLDSLGVLAAEGRASALGDDLVEAAPLDRSRQDED